MASTRLPEHWDAIVAQHALCVLRLQTGRREEAYSALASVVQPFLKVLRGPVHFQPPDD